MHEEAEVMTMTTISLNKQLESSKRQEKLLQHYFRENQESDLPELREFQTRQKKKEQLDLQKEQNLEISIYKRGRAQSIIIIEIFKKSRGNFLLFPLNLFVKKIQSKTGCLSKPYFILRIATPNYSQKTASARSKIFSIISLAPTKTEARLNHSTNSFSTKKGKLQPKASSPKKNTYHVGKDSTTSVLQMSTTIKGKSLFSDRDIQPVNSASIIDTLSQENPQ